jgi:hypothetical protein
LETLTSDHAGTDRPRHLSAEVQQQQQQQQQQEAS